MTGSKLLHNYQAELRLNANFLAPSEPEIEKLKNCKLDDGKSSKNDITPKSSPDCSEPTTNENDLITTHINSPNKKRQAEVKRGIMKNGKNT